MSDSKGKQVRQHIIEVAGLAAEMPMLIREHPTIRERSACLEVDLSGYVERGAKQLAVGAGFTVETALVGVDVAGFYALIDLLGYKVVGQSARKKGNDFIDEMRVTSKQGSGPTVAVFNLVPSERVPERGENQASCG